MKHGSPEGICMRPVASTAKADDWDVEGWWRDHQVTGVATMRAAELVGL